MDLRLIGKSHAEICCTELEYEMRFLRAEKRQLEREQEELKKKLQERQELLRELKSRGEKLRERLTKK